MKKLLILSLAMEIGGAEKSLLGLLDAIDYNKYTVDLFLLRHQGELLDYIPSSVNILPQDKKYSVLARPMVNTVKEGHFLLTAARLYGKQKARAFNKKNDFVKSDVELDYSHKYTKCFMNKINPNVVYDLAISFLTPHYFVSEKVNAKKKIAWIHTDYSVINIDIESELKMWRQYDKIAAVSDDVKCNFEKKFPSLSEKVFVFENILPENLVKKQSKNISNLYGNEISILSIGRFCDAKNFDNVPQICRLIREKGLNVKWYLIGYGGDEALIKSRIKEFGMEEYVIILGKKTNPYPYIKNCDLYVQPSRYEGKAVTVREAQMLCKPVVITKFATSSSQLRDGYDGIIVPMDNQGCADGIANVLENKELMQTLSENCAKNDYSNAEEVNKLYDIIENKQY